MSLTIMIGAEAQDYLNIKNTIHFLEGLKELNPLGVITEDQFEVLGDLIEWYSTMYDVMINPSLGGQELYDPKELVD
jgi:hypothetical protein